MACLTQRPDPPQRAPSTEASGSPATHFCWALAASALLLTLVVPATQAQTAAVTIDTTTCYLLSLGMWKPIWPLRQPVVYKPPTVIRFDAAVYTTPQRMIGRRRLVPNIDAIAARKIQIVPPYWLQPTPDSVHAVWSSGTAGIALELALQGDSLVGMAIAHYDVIGRAVPTATVVGRRTTCPVLLAPTNP